MNSGSHWTEIHEKDIFDWYVSLAKNPATKHHAWHMVQELDKRSNETGFHEGIKDRFLTVMKGKP